MRSFLQCLRFMPSYELLQASLTAMIPSRKVLKANIMSYSPQDPSNRFSAQQTFIVNRKTAEKEQIHFQDGCKRPGIRIKQGTHLSCHHQYQWRVEGLPSWEVCFGHHCCLPFPSVVPWLDLLPLHSHGAFPRLTPCRQGWRGVFQPHQPNCYSFPAYKWYKVWSCTSQCPNFNHLSALIDTNGFYKCKTLSSNKYVCLRRP